MISDEELEPIEEETEDPVYYSQRAITGFSLFFSVIFGAVLMMANLRNNPKARWTVFMFAIAYIFGSVLLVTQIGPNPLLSLALNGFGGAILTNYFWNKYLGSETPYIARPIWIPLIISLLIVIPMALAVMNEKGML